MSVACPPLTTMLDGLCKKLSYFFCIWKKKLKIKFNFFVSISTGSKKKSKSLNFRRKFKLSFNCHQLKESIYIFYNRIKFDAAWPTCCLGWSTLVSGRPCLGGYLHWFVCGSIQWCNQTQRWAPSHESGTATPENNKIRIKI